jgi:hypothetical protein
MSRLFQIDHAKNPRWREVLQNTLAEIRRLAEAGSITIKVTDVIRSLDQNSKMWPMLTDWARQVPWTINGELQLIDADDWKAILTAAFNREMRIAAGLHGGAVMLGARTSKFSRKTMADFITFLYAEGNERGVAWSEQSKEHARRYGVREAA